MWPHSTPTAFDDHTLGRVARPSAADPVANSNDVLRQLPALAEVCDSGAVRGALTSLCGRGYRMQVHRHVHFKGPGKLDGSATMPALPGSLHQDGRFRTLAGWNRFMRYPYLPLKVICFYYPEGVTDEANGPTQVVPSSHFLPELSPDVLDSTVSLVVPPGSFVLLHSSVWHRGTPEMAGKRRIMVKLNFDRTETPPASPSWDSRGGVDTEAWTPEVRHLWSWMAGRAAADRGGAEAEAERQRLFEVVAADDAGALLPMDRARAAFQLGAVATEEWAESLIAALPAGAEDTESGRPETHDGWAAWSSYPGWGVGLAVSACGGTAAGPLMRAIGSASGRRKALLLDLLIDCDSGDERLDCFAECLDDPDEWVRHTAVQAIECCGQALAGQQQGSSSSSAAAAARALLKLLGDATDEGSEIGDGTDEFLQWNAISAARYSAPSNDALEVLADALAPLEGHASPFLSWKAVCTRREIFSQDLQQNDARL